MTGEIHRFRNLFFLFGCCLALISCHSNNSENNIRHFPDSLFREGDLVFRRGTGIVSRAVLYADQNGMYSHIGILTNDSCGWQVIHAVPGEPDFPGDPDRVKKEPVEVFFSHGRTKTGAVMRIDGKRESIERAVEQAERYYRSGTPFDHQYDLRDTSKMYCTELVFRVFSDAGIDLTNNRTSRINIPGFKGDYILPGDIQKSPLIRLIYCF